MLIVNYRTVSVQFCWPPCLDSVHVVVIELKSFKSVTLMYISVLRKAFQVHMILCFI